MRVLATDPKRERVRKFLIRREPFMSRTSPDDGRLDYTEWASRLTHSEHEKVQDEFILRGRRIRTQPVSDTRKDLPAKKWD